MKTNLNQTGYDVVVFRPVSVRHDNQLPNCTVTYSVI